MFDDILIYSHTIEDHFLHLQTTLEILRQYHLLAKPSKCKFTNREVASLEHLISTEGVRADPGKLKAMEE